MNFVEYPDREMLAMSVADKIASDLGAALRHDDRVTFCVPGGTTPGPIFDALTAVKMDWDRVDVVLNDERWVPESSPRSNTALLRNRLLTGHAAAATMLPLYAETDRPEDALDGLSEALAPHMPINVLVLGMGTDMHTASIFPGADRLAEALAPDAPILLPMRADAADEPRITITARYLRGALATHVIITGTRKREVLERARSLSPEEAPIAAVLGDATVHWAE
ncbi:6-phosphogluconolactonase [Pseudooceanicola sediminis]|uniref:6-phosphogluconolactonase n=1 Tax=Pseudooceanicola sediminis TaxID=2211117 RepID=A0A399J2H6_9RHOB|nr:6-phosphogluconolactonase [Pseudooceanicola sediminis]KAA2317255.1 6-phosphogluconolactonase [Puniceibacterium sp. HSS470]RII39608.1 6-phosphogluconolactonase [Pseudooceanicola sediminis]|tara:strand:- start:4492 stop:5163 length:672 start_codon:yes stop_codon:yes gene_type:complete